MYLTITSQLVFQFTVGVIYRSPNSPPENNIKLIEVISKFKNSNLVIVGDFNYGNINWDLLEGDRDSTPFLECVLASNLTQLVEYPTRGNAMLDLVLSNQPEIMSPIIHAGSLGSSDHDLLTFHLYLPNPPKTKSIIRYNFNNKEFKLQNIPTTSVKQSWKTFDKQIQNFLSESKYTICPNKSCRPKWMTYLTPKKIKRKERLGKL